MQGLLTGKTKSGSGYSEFHFGAGEASVIRMVAEIELADEQSMVLIEEIENGRHPVATVRMVEYLIDAAERKKIQAIFTSHLNDAIRSLPSKAIWVAISDKIFQGKLDIQSLRAITGQIDARLVVFVEGRFAKIWLEAMLRQVGGLAIDHIQVHALQGDGTAVAINLHHNRDPSTNVRSVCFVDGDSRQKASAETGVYRLPGESPEAFVFDEVLSAWSEFGGKLAVALLQRFENAEAVKDACKSVRLSNRDPHLLFAQLGERLGLLPEATVAAAFANILGASVPLKVHDVLEHIRNLLPTETSDVRQPTKTGETTNHHPAA